MTRQIPMDRPLSDDDRAYLEMRGEETRITWFDQTFADHELDDEEDEDDEDVEDYNELTVESLKAEIERRNAAGSQISPASNKKADLVAALEADDEE